MTDTQQQHTITLEHGFIDSKQTAHKEIVFGRRVNGLDFINIDKASGRMGQSAANALTFLAAISKFGELQPGRYLDALLSLDDLEFEEVSRGFDAFRELGTSKPVILSDNSVRLAHGVEIEGVKYDVVTFGKPLRVYDEVAADQLRLSGVERIYYLTGVQISKLSTSDGQSELNTSLDHKAFYSMDSDDIVALKGCCDAWKERRRVEALKRRLAESEGESPSSEAVN
jgi:hypothetical protein